MSEMNRYIEMFMNDHNLKVDDEFRVKSIDIDIWHFNKDGSMENQVGFRNNKVLMKILLDECEIEKIEKGTKELWKPEPGEKYWLVSEYGHVHYNYNDNDKEDEYILTHSPVFRTEKETEDYKWFLDKIDEYKKPFEVGAYNYFFYYDHVAQSVYKTHDTSCQNQGTIYFGDGKNSDIFSEEVGEERIKKYMFNISK